jgi:hypothetical protein
MNSLRAIHSYSSFTTKKSFNIFMIDIYKPFYNYLMNQGYNKYKIMMYFTMCLFTELNENFINLHIDNKILLIKAVTLNNYNEYLLRLMNYIIDSNYFYVVDRITDKNLNIIRDDFIYQEFLKQMFDI